jgi:hypothetical protein
MPLLLFIMYKAESNSIAVAIDSSKKNIIIYPNSGTGILYIPDLPENIKLDIYNKTGEVVSSQLMNPGNCYLDLSDLASGIYTLSFKGANTSYSPVTWLK